MSTIWLAKCSIDGIRRIRKGQHQYKLACDRCGTVRWLPQSCVGTPHCYRGWFGFLLKKG